MDLYHTDLKVRHKRSMYEQDVYDRCEDLYDMLDLVKQEPMINRLYFKKVTRRNVKEKRKNDIMTFSNMYEIVNCGYENLVQYKGKNAISKLYELLK